MFPWQPHFKNHVFPIWNFVFFFLTNASISLKLTSVDARQGHRIRLNLTAFSPITLTTNVRSLMIPGAKGMSLYTKNIYTYRMPVSKEFYHQPTAFEVAGTSYSYTCRVLEQNKHRQFHTVINNCRSFQYWEYIC